MTHYFVRVESNAGDGVSGPLWSLDAALLECAERRRISPDARIGIAVHTQPFKEPEMIEYKGAAAEVRRQIEAIHPRLDYPKFLPKRGEL